MNDGICGKYANSYVSIIIIAFDSLHAILLFRIYFADCCDGADEWHPGGRCENSCRELGRAAREEAERQRMLAEEGHVIYKEYCTQGNEALKQKEVGEFNAMLGHNTVGEIS